jgi:GGDEF domain-containing protein
VNLVTRLVDHFAAGHEYECGRYSQDRIVCLFPKNGSEMAKKLIEHLRKNMEQDMFDTESGYTSSCVTFSIEAGMVSGKLPGELNLLVDRALQNNQVVSQFVCGELSREV